MTVRKPPLTFSAAAYEALLDQLLTGALRPGQRLKELEIAKEFAMSPTPIREALACMGQEGLIEIQPHRGALVKYYSEKDIIELKEIREFIEVAALQMAMSPDRFISEDTRFQKIERLIVEGEETVRTKDRVRFCRLDAKLHDLLVQLSDNSRLIDTYRRFYRQIQMLRLQRVFLPKENSASQKEHEGIFAAIKRGDSIEAVEALRKHLQGFLRLHPTESLVREVTVYGRGRRTKPGSDTT